MDANRYHKKYIQKLIHANPSTVTVIRKVKTPDGYGGHTIETDETTEIVTFYERRIRRELADEQGVTYTGINISKILTLYDADIKEGDIINYEGRTFKVLFVKFYKELCKQIELEVIK